MSDDLQAAERGRWPDYRAVWRWHFYASLFCLPFVVVLSISGAIYLFKPQIEAYLDRPYDQLALTAAEATVADQVRAAVAAVPDSTPSGYELRTSDTAAARVLVRASGQTHRVYVQPQTLEILHQIPEEQRLMRWLFKLHGELLMGDRGSNLVEIAACWTIVMLLTGLFLWWPRKASRGAGVLYPRLRQGARLMWRDLHAVTGFWIVGCALLLLATGLPWAKFWGNYFKAVRRWTGTAVAQQDWTTGSERGEHSGHAGHGGGGSGGGGNAAAAKKQSARPTTPVDFAAFDRVVAAVTPLHLEHPVVISPPSRGGDKWTAKSQTPNRPRRVNLVVDGRTGEILSREDYRDRHWVDRILGVGIAAHEGQLFGWPNQLIGLLTACGLVLLCVSGLILWWRRRDPGTLGAPAPRLPARFSWLLLFIILALALYLPLFGLTLVLVRVAEWLVLKRIPMIRRWLGLPGPMPLEAG
ncbi:MAG: PepSY-associated TM helix domain-containing protein [Planctomycetota bacterium]